MVCLSGWDLHLDHVAVAVVSVLRSCLLSRDDWVSQISVRSLVVDSVLGSVSGFDIGPPEAVLFLSHNLVSGVVIDFDY